MTRPFKFGWWYARPKGGTMPPAPVHVLPTPWGLMVVGTQFESLGCYDWFGPVPDYREPDGPSPELAATKELHDVAKEFGQEVTGLMASWSIINRLGVAAIKYAESGEP